MAIRGAENMSAAELSAELSRGGKIVIFEYCISVVILTFKRGSEPHLVRAGEGTFGKAFPYLLVSLLFGWWGIPWGFIYTPMAIITNLGGGKDVTAQVAGALPRVA